MAHNSQARGDLLSTDYTVADKTIQLAGRLASIPAAISGLPAKLVEEIRPGFGEAVAQAELPTFNPIPVHPEEPPDGRGHCE
ncbi:MAG TPA: hypothetical protein VGJ81_15915 [Thermoanaerobaculia bacterium]|jgi:hypothetical protein